jgi:hypothetical protein
MKIFENSHDEDWKLQLSSDDDDSRHVPASRPNTSISVAGANVIKLFMVISYGFSL